MNHLPSCFILGSLVLLLFCASCTQRLYTLNYLDFEAPQTKELYTQLLDTDSLEDYTVVAVYKSVLYECEVPSDGIFDVRLVPLENCVGMIYGSHELTILQFMHKIQKTSKYVIVSASKTVEEQYIGPTYFFYGEKDDQAARPRVWSSLTYTYKPKRKHGYELKRKKTDMDIYIKLVNPDYMIVDQVSYHINTKITDKATSFVFKSILGNDLVLVRTY